MTVARIRMLTDKGVDEFDVHVDSEASRMIGQHWNAIQHFLHTGEIDRLSQFAIWRIANRRFAVSPEWIEKWASRNEPEWDEIYESPS